MYFSFKIQNNLNLTVLFIIDNLVIFMIGVQCLHIDILLLVN